MRAALAALLDVVNGSVTRFSRGSTAHPRARPLSSGRELGEGGSAMSRVGDSTVSNGIESGETRGTRGPLRR